MKIIFIDIDGPLAWGTVGMDKVELRGSYVTGQDFTIPYPWVKEDCDALKEILESTDARLVLSSDWRKHFSFYQMRKVFEHYGISGNYLLDFTTHQNLWRKISRSTVEWDRASEIVKWVKDNKVKSWIAIDDLPLQSSFKYIKVPMWRQVQVDGHFGEGHRIRDKVEECITKLNK